MRINKITTGFVVQTWDTELKKWIAQEFVAGDLTDYEKADGTSVDPSDIWPDIPEPYLPFAMQPPEELRPRLPRFYVLETIGDIEPQLHGPFQSPELRDEQAVQRRIGARFRRTAASVLTRPYACCPSFGCGRMFTTINQRGGDMAMAALALFTNRHGQ
jgi:hypothetical protein